MKIERHKIDEPYLSEMGERSRSQFEGLFGFVESAKRNPKNLTLLATNAREAAAYGLIVNAPTTQISEALKLAARATSALFQAAHASPANPVTVRLDDAPATYASPPDGSTVHVGRWITGFYLSIIARDQDALNSLCSTPLGSLRSSSSRFPEYVYLYAQSLRDFATRQWKDIVQTMLAAVKATDPERPDITDPDWALDLHVPQLEVLIYAVTKDAKFGDALARAVALHKKYWSKKKDLRLRDYEGFLAVELTALAKIGLDQGLSFDIDSPYVPMQLIT